MKQQSRPIPLSASKEKQIRQAIEAEALRVGASALELGGLPFCMWVQPVSINLVSYKGYRTNATASLSLMNYGDEIAQGRFYFNRLFLDRDLRGKGLGTAMVKEIQCKMTELHRGILCEPNPYDGPKKLQALLRFYRRCGFREHKDESTGYCLLWDPPADTSNPAPSSGGPSAQTGG